MSEQEDEIARLQSRNAYLEARLQDIEQHRAADFESESFRKLESAYDVMKRSFLRYADGKRAAEQQLAEAQQENTRLDERLAQALTDLSGIKRLFEDEREGRIQYQEQSARLLDKIKRQEEELRIVAAQRQDYKAQLAEARALVEAARAETHVQSKYHKMYQEQYEKEHAQLGEACALLKRWIDWQMGLLQPGSSHALYTDTRALIEKSGYPTR